MKNTERLALLFGLGNLLTAASQLRALVGPATILTGFPAGGQPPAAPSRAKHQGLNAGQQRPDRSSHSLHRSVKYNLHQGDPIQSILSSNYRSCRLKEFVLFCRYGHCRMPTCSSEEATTRGCTRNLRRTK